MRKLTQKLVLSVVTMALVVVALGTSTFAWFTLQNTASLGNFTADVTAGEGIEVSLGTFTRAAGVDGNLYTSDDVITYELGASPTWYTTIPGTVIEDRLELMYGSQLTLKDVTSDDGKIMNRRDLVLGFTQVDGYTGNFIELKLWFRSSSAKTITLDNLVITGDSKPWKVDTAHKAANTNAFTDAADLGVGTNIRVAAWTAARVSVFGSTLGGVYQRAAVSGTSFEDTVYNSDVLPEVSYELNKQFGAASYYAVKTNGAIVAPVSDPINTTIPDAVKLDATGKINGTAADAVIGQNLVVLTGADNVFTGQITVRVWIEGWDADLYDAIFKTNLSVSMKFGVAA